MIKKDNGKEYKEGVGKTANFKLDKTRERVLFLADKFLNSDLSINGLAKDPEVEQKYHVTIWTVHNDLTFKLQRYDQEKYKRVMEKVDSFKPKVDKGRVIFSVNSFFNGQSVDEIVEAWNELNPQNKAGYHAIYRDLKERSLKYFDESVVQEINNGLSEARPANIRDHKK